MRRPAAAFLLAALLLGAGRLSAEEIRIEVLADRSQAAADEVIRLTYKFSGGGLSGDIKPPSLLPLKNLALAGGPARSDQVSFVNGVFSRSLSLTYYLRPKGPGPAEVGETVWTVGDKSVRAAPFLVEIGPPRGRSAAPVPEEEPEDPFSGFFGNRGVPRPGPGIGPGAGSDGRRAKLLVEILVTPDKTTAYVGEEVTLHVELVTSADVQGLEWVEPPKFPGAWAEDLERPERPTGRRDTVGDRPVMRFTLLKKLVSGLSPGTLTIPPVKIRTTVRTAGDPFGDPFGAFFRAQPIELESKPVTLKILPIPGEKPFTGPVGRFELTARLDKNRVAVGEAATLKVRLTGSGGLRTATAPPRISVPDAKVYPPTTRTEPAKGGKPGAVEWDYVVVPSAPGEIGIPAVAIETFDPAERKFVTRATAPLRLAAEGAPLLAASASTTTSADTTFPTPVPAAPASPAPGPAVDLSRRTVTLPLWLLLAIPAGVVVATGGWLLVRRRRVPRLDLRGALAPEPGETKERAAARIDRVLRDGLAKRHGIPEGATAAAILAALAEKEVPQEVRRDAEKLLADLDFLRFAPQLGDYSAKIAEVREEASALLPRLF